MSVSIFGGKITNILQAFRSKEVTFNYRVITTKASDSKYSSQNKADNAAS